MFDEALKATLGIEGEYSDHPDDPGGKTRWGVTEAVARASGYTGDMRDYPIEDAKKLYLKQYWNPITGDELPWPLSKYVFDFAVNSGVRQAILTLQRTLNIPMDGVIGPQTLQKAKAMNAEQLALYLADRAMFMASLGTFTTFGRGWFKRLFIIK